MMRLLTVLLFLLFGACQRAPPDDAGLTAAAEERNFSLDELQRRTFGYFWETALADNYQIPDRWPTDRFSSIAATGFGLTSYIVGSERGYVTREEAATRTLNTLEKLWSLPQGPEMSGVAGYKGLFYHFLTNDEALRYRDVELSTIDTGLLMAGVLSVMSYFDGAGEDETRIRELADQLYRRVEWDWSLNEKGRMSMGWRPDRGFIPAEWNGYNEAMILVILGLGSPTHPLPDNAWERWTEGYDWQTFQGYEHLNFTPLFGHQYSHMYVDFRDIQDDYMREHDSDYFKNSVKGTLSNRAYCIDNPEGFTGYGPEQWGLTACDGPGGLDTLVNGEPIKFYSYRARGASADHIIDDGTIAPTAAGGVRALRARGMHRRPGAYVDHSVREPGGALRIPGRFQPDLHLRGGQRERLVRRGLPRHRPGPDPDPDRESPLRTDLGGDEEKSLRAARPGTGRLYGGVAR